MSIEGIQEEKRRRIWGWLRRIPLEDVPDPSVEPTTPADRRSGLEAAKEHGLMALDDPLPLLQPLPPPLPCGCVGFNDMEPWGKWGDEPACTPLLSLRRFLEDNHMSVWSEHGESPDGWVNVGCADCRRTYEVTLQAPWETE